MQVSDGVEEAGREESTKMSDEVVTGREGERGRMSVLGFRKGKSTGKSSGTGKN